MWGGARAEVSAPAQTRQAVTCRARDPRAPSTRTAAVIGALIPPPCTPRLSSILPPGGRRRVRPERGLRGAVSNSASSFEIRVSRDLALSHRETGDARPLVSALSRPGHAGSPRVPCPDSSPRLLAAHPCRSRPSLQGDPLWGPNGSETGGF